jgi:hypothetical protein
MKTPIYVDKDILYISHPMMKYVVENLKKELEKSSKKKPRN